MPIHKSPMHVVAKVTRAAEGLTLVEHAFQAGGFKSFAQKVLDTSPRHLRAVLRGTKAIGPELRGSVLRNVLWQRTEADAFFAPVECARRMVEAAESEEDLQVVLREIEARKATEPGEQEAIALLMIEANAAFRMAAFKEAWPGRQAAFLEAYSLSKVAFAAWQKTDLVRIFPIIDSHVKSNLASSRWLAEYASVGGQALPASPDYVEEFAAAYAAAKGCGHKAFRWTRLRYLAEQIAYARYLGIDKSPHEAVYADLERWLRTAHPQVFRALLEAMEDDWSLTSGGAVQLSKDPQWQGIVADFDSRLTDQARAGDPKWANFTARFKQER